MRKNVYGSIYLHEFSIFTQQLMFGVDNRANSRQDADANVHSEDAVHACMQTPVVMRRIDTSISK